MPGEDDQNKEDEAIIIEANHTTTAMVVGGEDPCPLTLDRGAPLLPTRKTTRHVAVNRGKQ